MKWFTCSDERLNAVDKTRISRNYKKNAEYTNTFLCNSNYSRTRSLCLNSREVIFSIISWIKDLDKKSVRQCVYDLGLFLKVNKDFIKIAHFQNALKSSVSVAGKLICVVCKLRNTSGYWRLVTYVCIPKCDWELHWWRHRAIRRENDKQVDLVAQYNMYHRNYASEKAHIFEKHAGALCLCARDYRVTLNGCPGRAFGSWMCKCHASHALQ